MFYRSTIARNTDMKRRQVFHLCCADTALTQCDADFFQFCAIYVADLYYLPSFVLVYYNMTCTIYYE